MVAVAGHRWADRGSSDGLDPAHALRTLPPTSRGQSSRLHPGRSARPQSPHKTEPHGLNRKVRPGVRGATRYFRTPVPMTNTPHWGTCPSRPAVWALSADLPELCALLRTTKGRQLYLPTPGADVAWRAAERRLRA
jgi:hypothetical protein